MPQQLCITFSVGVRIVEECERALQELALAPTRDVEVPRECMAAAAFSQTPQRLGEWTERALDNASRRCIAMSAARGRGEGKFLGWRFATVRQTYSEGRTFTMKLFYTVLCSAHFLANGSFSVVYLEAKPQNFDCQCQETSERRRTAVYMIFGPRTEYPNNLLIRTPA